MSIPFVKGQMGGNRIVLLDGRAVPDGEDRRVALAALAPEALHGHQAGLLRPGDAPGHLRVRVVSISWRDFIPACGGLTQVLGHALLGSPVATWLGLTPGESPWRVTLDFDAWPVELRVHHDGARVTRVDADLSAFVGECRGQDIGSMDLDDTPAWRVGTFLVLDAEAVTQRIPGLDVAALDDASRAELLRLHHRFQGLTGQESWDFALYDWRAEGHRDVRVVFPHALPIDHVEPACGTGSVALATALWESGAAARHGLDACDGRVPLRLETGGAAQLGGPETTEVALRVEGDLVTGATFSHSNVTLTAVGELPG